MTASWWLPPFIRAVATALLVVTASSIAEALGPFWGALIASLPVSSGPAYVFLAVQHGGDFIAASALSSSAANAATGLFLIVYAALAGSAPLWRSLGGALLVWFAACLVTQQIGWTPVTALLANLVVYGAGHRLVRSIRTRTSTPAVGGEGAGWAGSIRTRTSTPAIPVRRTRFDMPVRAVSVAAFVTLVVAVSSFLGPRATGIATVFPVSLISLLVIVQTRIGGLAAARLAAMALISMFGFGMMLLAFHLTTPAWGATAGLVAGFSVSALWSVGLLLLRRRPGG